MTIQLDRTDAGGSRLEHILAGGSAAPRTHFAWVFMPFAGAEQTVFSEVQVAAGRRVRFRAYQNSASSQVVVGNISSWGAAQNGATEDLSNTGTLEPLMVVRTSDASMTVFTSGNTTGVVVDTTNGTPSDFTAADMLLLGATYFDAAYQGRGSLHIADYLVVDGTALGSTHFAALTATTPPAPESITLPVGATIYDCWAFNPAGAAGTAVTGTLTGLVNGRTFTIVGDVRVSSRASPVTRSGPAPVLSSPTVVSTGNTIATVRVTTDTAPSGSSTLAVQILPAATPAPTDPAVILGAPTLTITSGASGARDFNLTGQTNGTAYRAHFAQTGPSNVVSTASFTPSTVPGAPTIGTAVAGNAQATVNGTAPASNGGSAITGYRSTATPGGSTVTGASLPITHTGLSNGTAYTFTLAAQNANGYGSESAASNSVTPAAPGTAPTITVQPSNQTVTAGATATFSVTATGSGLTYQWRRNGTPIGGATSASYSLSTVLGDNGAVFSVVVTGDTAPAATSSNATLTVNAATGPTLPAVAADATGSAKRLGQTTRMVVEPFTTIEALGTGARTIATGTTDPTTGQITLTGLSPGTYAVFGFFPSTGAAIQGVRFRLVTVA